MLIENALKSLKIKRMLSLGSVVLHIEQNVSRCLDRLIIENTLEMFLGTLQYISVSTRYAPNKNFIILVSTIIQ